ncbi:MAG: helix-turn-helix transcriptional regulator [Lachnospiraceae bacterium]|nr:helix-turn-helix transcriptional regulator [Lachnospiraceae bacterium]
MLSVDSVSNIENGKTTCMPEHIMRLYQLFNVSADYFYFGISKNIQDVEIDIYQVLELCHEEEKEKIRKIAMVLLDIEGK